MIEVVCQSRYSQFTYAQTLLCQEQDRQTDRQTVRPLGADKSHFECTSTGCAAIIKHFLRIIIPSSRVMKNKKTIEVHAHDRGK